MKRKQTTYTYILVYIYIYPKKNFIFSRGRWRTSLADNRVVSVLARFIFNSRIIENRNVGRLFDKISRRQPRSSGINLFFNTCAKKNYSSIGISVGDEKFYWTNDTTLEFGISERLEGHRTNEKKKKQNGETSIFLFHSIDCDGTRAKFASLEVHTENIDWLVTYRQIRDRRKTYKSKRVENWQCHTEQSQYIHQC